MDRRGIFLEPLPAIAVALVFEDGHDSGPIEPGAAIISLFRIRQVQARVQDTVVDFRFRESDSSDSPDRQAGQYD